jgi:hypothetical protein
MHEKSVRDKRTRKDFCATFKTLQKMKAWISHLVRNDNCFLFYLCHHSDDQREEEFSCNIDFEAIRIFLEINFDLLKYKPKLLFIFLEESKTYEFSFKKLRK